MKTPNGIAQKGARRYRMSEHGVASLKRELLRRKISFCRTRYKTMLCRTRMRTNSSWCYECREPHMCGYTCPRVIDATRDAIWLATHRKKNKVAGSVRRCGSIGKMQSVYDKVRGRDLCICGYGFTIRSCTKCAAAGSIKHLQ